MCSSDGNFLVVILGNFIGAISLLGAETRALLEGVRLARMDFLDVKAFSNSLTNI